MFRFTFFKSTVLHFLLSIILVSCYFSGFSQTYHYTQYSVENGLAQSQVLCLYQDENDNMWIGTNGEGINKFNGKKFNNITTQDGLVGNYVYCIVKDSKGLMWIGTNSGISIFDGKKYQNFSTEQGLPHNRVYAIAEDKSRKQMWIATEKGVAIYKNGKISTFTKSETLVNTFVYSLLVDKKNNVWFGTYGKGLVRLSGNNIQNYTKENGLYMNVVRTMEQDHKGNIIIGTLNGLNYFDYQKDTIKSIAIDNPNSVNTITDCIIEENGDIWISVYSGNLHKLRYINNNLSLVFSIYTIGSAKNIWTLFQDREKNIWFGTIDFGLFRFGGLRFYNYNEDNDKLQNNSVYAICQSRDGNFWIGTKNSGIAKMITDEQSRKPEFIDYTYNMVNVDGKPRKMLKLAGSSITSIMEDKDGALWVTTSNGLTMLRNDSLFNFLPTEGNNKLAKIIVKPGLTSLPCNHIIQDHRGTFWVGTPNGVTKIIDTTFINFNKTFPILEKKNIYQIYQDHERQLWFMSDSGVYVYNYKNIKHIGKEDGLVNEMVVTVTQDKENNYWFGTKQGVFFYNPTVGYKHIDAASGLSSNNIYLLIFDNDGNLFIGTPKGLDMLNARKFVSEGVVEIRHFGNQEGFIGQECNLNACFKDKKGKLWFGTVKGVTIFDPAYDKINPVKPYTQITNMKLAYKEFNWAPYCDKFDEKTGLPVNLVLPYDKNHITFEFVASSLTIPEKVKYQVMLEGLDTDWSPPRSKNEAEYPALPPGDYTFKVRACNNDGIWEEVPTTITFTIKPPFWKTWWFYTIVVITILIIIYIFIKRREAALRRDKMILEEKVRQRTAEVVKQKEIVEQKNKDITDSINYAKNIQLALLPNIKVFEDTFPDSFVLYRPRDIVSGDFYWMSHKDTRTFFAASDCTGHGVPGAFMSMLGIAFLDEIVGNNPDINANQILNQLRFNVIDSLHQTGKMGESKDGMDIGLVVVDWTKRQLQFAGANNPLYLIRNKELIEIKPDKMPIGFHIKTQDFTNNIIDLLPDDKIYVFSDGYADQFGGPDGKKFKYKQFKEVVLEICHLTAKEQREILENKLLDWKGNFDQLDDVLVMGIMFQEEHFQRFENIE
ncbi:MAG: hypothetical protein A2W91_00475 [Bacteroidetes bacterium GWF2_38_335]|nr:MAG: hypothetical protein A2W91_00475 [Bacteroidetes bacterium GWF2_38_335]OFY78307.1 MAG: hypothetical protein A2281_03855 [Bacteroidetes bacterium RIFOXYA12_FULL_38_20]HBS87497.1 hypothetical protein [Bacteroidales bacterium]